MKPRTRGQLSRIFRRLKRLERESWSRAVRDGSADARNRKQFALMQQIVAVCFPGGAR